MATAAFEYLRANYGGDVEIKEGSTVTGVANVSILGTNAEAVTLNLVNGGAFDIYVWWDNTVSASKGIKLAANGGFLSLNVVDDAVLPTMDWHAVSPGGASSISFLACLRSTKVGVPA